MGLMASLREAVRKGADSELGQKIAKKEKVKAYADKHKMNLTKLDERGEGKWTHVQSSNVEAVRYNPSMQMTEVTFKSKPDYVYQYAAGKGTADRIAESASPGKSVIAALKGESTAYGSEHLIKYNGGYGSPQGTREPTVGQMKSRDWEGGRLFGRFYN